LEFEFCEFDERELSSLELEELPPCCCEELLRELCEDDPFWSSSESAWTAVAPSKRANTIRAFMVFSNGRRLGRRDTRPVCRDGLV
jgi:hypothetical protein